MNPVAIEDFRGLVLATEQGETAGAVAMLNADLTRGNTQVGTRSGLSLLATGTTTYHLIGPADNNTEMLAVRVNGANLTVDDITTAGVVSLGGTFVTATRAVSIQHVDSGALLTAVNTTTTNMPLRLYTGGGTLSTPSATNKPRFACASASGRAVIAHFNNAADTPSGADGNKSTVWFSNVDSAITFGADNWIQVGTGDGEQIRGLVTWRNLTFIVKESAMFVHTGESIDSLGAPIFNEYRVGLPAGVRARTSDGAGCVIAGGDAVYLLLKDGVYRTTGDTPQMISQAIAPIFDGTGDSTLTFPDASGEWSFGYAANRVYLSYKNGSSYYTLVYDTRTGEWLLWDISLGSSVLPSNVFEYYDANTSRVPYVAVGARMCSMPGTGATTDVSSVAIASSYQTAFDGLGAPLNEKRITGGVELVGTGTPTVNVFTDYATSDPLTRGAAVTLGVSPAVAGALHRKSYRGRLFSTKVSATSGAWTVMRLGYQGVTVRPAGIRSS